MDHIIAGRFPTKAKADAAAATIVRYVDRTDICIFHNNPVGQHGTAVKGEVDAINPGSDMAEESAATSALAAGLAAGAVGGPVVALAAAGVAAYTGSLVGSLNGTEGDTPANTLHNHRPAGVILAVRIARPGNEEFVIDDLQAFGADDIEQAEGEWRDGDWVDFNPLQEPHLITSITQPTAQPAAN